MVSLIRWRPPCASRVIAPWPDPAGRHARLTETLTALGCWDESWSVPTSGGIIQARQRLGYEPMKKLFAEVTAPVAEELTAGAFLGPWRLMAIDGFEWDAPDTPENAAAFGFPGTAAGGPGRPAYPKVRVVTVSECASHAVADAAMGGVAGKGAGEQSLARGLYLLTHYALSSLICRAVTEAGIDPDRVKFKRTVRIFRRRAADPAAFPPEHQERILATVMADITRKKHLNPERRHRTYPRVIKRGRHNSYRVKRPGDHGTRHKGPATIKLVNLDLPVLAA
jgi:Insertion element 4 transposase N-terminal